MLKNKGKIDWQRYYLFGMLLLLTHYSTFANSNKTHPISDPLVTLEFHEAPIAVLLQALADYKKINLVYANEQSFDKKLSLKLHEVPWSSAWATALQLANLTVKQEANIFIVTHARSNSGATPINMPAVTKENTPLIAHKKAEVIFQHIDAEEALKRLNENRATLLSPQGEVMLDQRNNRLLLQDNPKSLMQAKEWLHGIDMPLQQVQLSAHIVSMSSAQLNELGIRWGSILSEAPLSANINSNFSVPNATAIASFNIAKIDSYLLELELSALEQENEVDIIASPRLITSSQHTASIKQGFDIPYQNFNKKGEQQSIEFKEAVLGMEVTPIILANNQIRLNLKITQNMPGMVLNKTDSNAVSIEKQEIQTQVTIKNGETLILGGVFQQKQSKHINRIPYLSTIPIIGNLFKYRKKQKNRHELIIFITSHIVAV